MGENPWPGACCKTDDDGTTRIEPWGNPWGISVVALMEVGILVVIVEGIVVDTWDVVVIGLCCCGSCVVEIIGGLENCEGASLGLR